MKTKTIIILAILGIGAYFIFKPKKEETEKSGFDFSFGGKNKCQTIRNNINTLQNKVNVLLKQYAYYPSFALALQIRELQAKIDFLRHDFAKAKCIGNSKGVVYGCADGIHTSNTPQGCKDFGGAETIKTF